MNEMLKLLPDRSGISYNGEAVSGFPYLTGMSDKAKLRVARWAQQLAPDGVTEEQERILSAQPRRVASEAQREAMRQDEILSSPLVRELWRRLPDPERQLVLNPDAVLGKRYPLSTGELATVTGLSKRQIQYWSSERDLLPSWTDVHGYRQFETPAAIIAFALRDSKQHERQFYADLGTEAEPLRKAPEAIGLLGIRILAVLKDANSEALTRTEIMLRTVADSIAQAREEVSGALSRVHDEEHVEEHRSSAPKGVGSGRCP